MNSDLATRIQRAYPTGLLSERNDLTFESLERDERLRAVLEAASLACNFRYVLNPSDKPDYRIAITQQGHPSVSEWVLPMNGAEKLSWIREHDKVYPVFWLNVSRVADYYRCFYNFWFADDDSANIDVKWQSNPTGLWVGVECFMKAKLEESGFVLCSDDFGSENTPFVLEQDLDSIPYDDLPCESEGFVPALMPSSVFSCLFRL